jgi:hypothetical protein
LGRKINRNSGKKKNPSNWTNSQKLKIKDNWKINQNLEKPNLGTIQEFHLSLKIQGKKWENGKNTPKS